jgi:hypothetical protein
VALSSILLNKGGYVTERENALILGNDAYHGGRKTGFELIRIFSSYFPCGYFSVFLFLSEKYI